MKDDELDDSYIGRRLTVRHCTGAVDSYKNAMSGVKTKERKKYKRFMELQIKRLANGEPLSRDSFPKEGELPRLPGGTKKYFRALKRLPIRAYCWKSEKHPNIYYISHYVIKKKDSLDARDVQIVGNNWVRIEVDEDEC